MRWSLTAWFGLSMSVGAAAWEMSPAQRVEGRWLGQIGEDRVGPSSKVEPSGVQDLVFELRGLPRGRAIERIDVRGHGGDQWLYRGAYGPWAAELDRPDDGATARLFLEPGRDETGRSFEFEVTLKGGGSTRFEIRGGTASAALRAASAALRAVWDGVGGRDRTGRGPAVGPDGEPDAVVRLERLMKRRELVSVELTAAGLPGWSSGPNPEGRWNAEVERAGKDAEQALVYFSADRGLKKGLKLDVKVDYDDGTSDRASVTVGSTSVRSSPTDAVSREGSPERPARSVPASRPARRIQDVGDEAELRQAIAQGSDVRVRGGLIRLISPVVLDRGQSIRGEPGAVLEFAQGAAEGAWASAVTIGQGGSGLADVAIRFAGPVRWDATVPFGPAIVGIQPRRPESEPAIEGLSFERVAIESPPPATEWEHVPSAFRLTGARSGRIEACTIAGGTIELEGGPWTIRGNRFVGPPAGTFAYSVITAHWPNSLTVADNEVTPATDAGKLWRFLVLTRAGEGVVVEENRIRGVGPRDNDSHPHPNAPEVILSEGYRVRYEGYVERLEQGGQLLHIGHVQGEPVRPGDVVAVVGGPAAGAWARVAELRDAQTLGLDRPLPQGSECVQIAPGFVDCRFERNTIDCAGSTQALPLVLAGSHFGTIVRENVLIGGAESMRVTAFPTEQPIQWGWSYAASFDVKIELNRTRDAAGGGFLGVEHQNGSKRTTGRTYFTAQLEGNEVAWSAEWLAREPRRPFVAWTIGQAGVGEPAEQRLDMRASLVDLPSGVEPGEALRIEAGVVNGRAYRQAWFALARKVAEAPR